MSFYRKWENIRGNQITLPSPARPGAQTSVFTSRYFSFLNFNSTYLGQLTKLAVKLNHKTVVKTNSMCFVIMLEHKGSRQHHQAYAIEKSYCLPQERYSEERMRSFPSLQRRCRPMCPGKLLKFCLSSVTHMTHMDFIG